MLNADVVISELLASNVNGLRDNAGDSSDWLEIHNRDTSAVDLNGWYLTDDIDDLAKWQFPASTVLAPDGTSVELFTDTGGNLRNLIGTTLDDAAARPITAGLSPSHRRFKPEGNLSDLNRTEVVGTWTLQITNNASSSSLATLRAWSLEIVHGLELIGNLNHDSHLDATDIDVLFANLGSPDPTFDLDGDGDADRQDVRYLVVDILGRQFGDVNLDQKVDTIDANIVITNFDPLGTNLNNGWGQGNLDGDKDVDITDLFKEVLHYAPLGYSIVGDLNDDLMLASADIDRFYADLGTADASFHKNLDVRYRKVHPTDIVGTSDHGVNQDVIFDIDYRMRVNRAYDDRLGVHKSQASSGEQWTLGMRDLDAVGDATQ